MGGLLMKRLIELWDRIEITIATFTITGAFVLTFIEVIARLCFNTSFYWAKEFIIFFTRSTVVCYCNAFCACSYYHGAGT